MLTVCWPILARVWEGMVFPIDVCSFWTPLRMAPRRGYWWLRECQFWARKDGRAQPWGPLLTLGHVALTRHALLQAGARVPLGVSCVCQPETEALRGLRTPTVCADTAAWWDAERRLVALSGRSGQVPPLPCQVLTPDPGGPWKL